MTQKSSSDPGAAEPLRRFRDWFVRDASPLWRERGYDPARGGFYEALNFDASPFTGRARRVRTQARQIHTFSQIGLRGWDAGAEALAAEGFEYFLARACPDNGARGCVFHLDDAGNVINARRDLYDQAFLLLACASRWEAVKDQRALALAEATIAFMDRELSSAHGGWLESDKRDLPRRQNPHMHLFEAFLALHRVTGRDDFLARANALRVLFGRIFYDPRHGAVREFFDAEWDLTDEDQPVEPGHMLEWSWLLGAYERAGGEGGLEIRRTLYQRARVLGLDPGFFGFYDNQAPLTCCDHGAKRLWPQTEGLRAALSLGHEEDAALLADNLFRTYLATEIAGLWIDEFDADGRPIAKDTPASILYHLYEAVAEADAVLSDVASSGEAG